MGNENGVIMHSPSRLRVRHTALISQHIPAALFAMPHEHTRQLGRIVDSFYFESVSWTTSFNTPHLQNSLLRSCARQAQAQSKSCARHFLIA